MTDIVERLRAEDARARLAVEAFCAPDADWDEMIDSLQARFRDLHVRLAAAEAVCVTLLSGEDAYSDLERWREVAGR